VSGKIQFIEILYPKKAILIKNHLQETKTGLTPADGIVPEYSCD
jgi:hypothetical protein